MTKYLRSALFVTCTFCAIVAFCAAGEWKEYVYAGDGFAISSPMKPGIKSRTEKLAAGDMEVHTYSIFLHDSQMKIMYGLLPANDKRTPEQVLNDAKQTFITAGEKGTSEKTISIGKYPGIEIEVKDPQYPQWGRLYAVNRKMYALHVEGPKGKPLPEEMQRWYDSFRLVGTEK